MRKFILGLFLLGVTACRSLPQETVDAYSVSREESSAIIAIWNDKIVPEAGKADSVIDVNALTVEYLDHVHKLIVSRDTIQTYLDSSKGDIDAALGFHTATNLLMNIDANINMILDSWDLWINPITDADQFILDINDMIVSFKLLDNKFNEWVKQFGVK